MSFCYFVLFRQLIVKVEERVVSNYRGRFTLKVGSRETVKDKGGYRERATRAILTLVVAQDEVPPFTQWTVTFLSLITQERFRVPTEPMMKR